VKPPYPAEEPHRENKKPLRWNGHRYTHRGNRMEKVAPRNQTSPIAPVCKAISKMDPATDPQIDAEIVRPKAQGESAN
jgi:hypothetical protein